MTQGYIVSRRKRPLSRGTLYQVFTREAWMNDGKPCLVTSNYARVLALKRGLPDPEWSNADAMPGAKAAIVRPLRRYL